MGPDPILLALSTKCLIRNVIPDHATWESFGLPSFGLTRESTLSERYWDLIVISDKQLVLAMEFKSQAGKSIGNNVNNRPD